MSEPLIGIDRAVDSIKRGIDSLVAALDIEREAHTNTKRELADLRDEHEKMRLSWEDALRELDVLRKVLKR